MYIGRCLSSDTTRRVEEDPMEELGNILHGEDICIPADVMEEAREKMINEIMSKSQETMEMFERLKYLKANNKLE